MSGRKFYSTREPIIAPAQKIVYALPDGQVVGDRVIGTVSSRALALREEIYIIQEPKSQISNPQQPRDRQ